MHPSSPPRFWSAAVVLGLLLAVPACLPAAMAAGRAAGELPAREDSRLSQRFSVRAEGITLRALLQRLREGSGVSLSVAARAGDERVVAFVPDAPLSEIMARLAELYRLTWTRNTADRPSYSLIKRPAALREEQALRESAVQATLHRLSAELSRPPAADAARSRAAAGDRSSPSCGRWWRPAPRSW